MSHPDPDELEPGYVESVRRFNARQRAENLAAWSRGTTAARRRGTGVTWSLSWRFTRPGRNNY